MDVEVDGGCVVELGAVAVAVAVAGTVARTSGLLLG